MNKNNIINSFKIVTSIVVLVLVTGCLNKVSANISTINAVIEFDDAGCPSDTSVNRDLTTKGKSGDKITFTSNPLKTGTEYNEFELTFDPFVGRPYKSRNGVLANLPPLSGQATPSKHQKNQTAFQFKYIINAEGCDPVDPMVIIEK